MRNLLITIRFCGTRYHGFQVQKNALSVCEVFQDALEALFRKRLDVKGCSRTDAGVHANCYCLSVRCDTAIPCDKIVLALNTYLPHDVAVVACRDVPEDFHARYSATAKEYVYKIRNSRVRDPFSHELSYRYGFKLDEELLNRQAQAFVGAHDFSAFRSAGADEGDAVREIYAFSVTRKGEMVYFTVSGNGFLYNMVRIMVGTLIYIHMGRIACDTIPQVILSRERARAGKTMPACGLYLNRVWYGDAVETGITKV